MADQVLVFISHTSAMTRHPEGTSFVDGADAAVNAIDRAKAFHMAYFTAAEMTPADYSVRELARASLFVAVIGFDHGSTVRGDSRSYTELEFDEATRRRLPRLVFLLREDAIGLQRLTSDVVSHHQRRFRAKVEESGATVRYFSSVDELKYEVSAAVRQWLAADDERRRREAVRPVPQPGPRPTPRPPSPSVGKAGSAAAVGCLLTVVAAMVAVLLAVWTFATGTFPPWSDAAGSGEDGGKAAECAGLSMTITGTSEPFPGVDEVVLVVDLKNSTDQRVDVPGAREVVALGSSGRQYATANPAGDPSWIHSVRVEPGATRQVKLALQAEEVSDDITLRAAVSRDSGIRSSGCTLTSAPFTVGR